MSESSDGYICIKSDLLSCLEGTINKRLDSQNTINEAVTRCHKLTIFVYQFIKLYCIHCFDNQLPIPDLDYKLINMIFDLFSFTSGKGGRCPKDIDGSKNQKEKLQMFYDQHFVPLLGDHTDKISKTYIQQIITSAAKTIETVFANNVKIHFVKRVNSFVKKMFFNDHQDDIASFLDSNKPDPNDSKSQRSFKKSFIKLHQQLVGWQLRIVKSDILNSTINDDNLFKEWTREYQDLLKIPIPEISIPYDITIIKNHKKFIGPMIMMNRILEDNGFKMFNAFPLCNSIIPGHFTFDTKTIGMIFKMGFNVYNNVNMNKQRIWSEIFDLNNKIFKNNHKRCFHHQISTDGVSVSILHIANSSSSQTPEGGSSASSSSTSSKKPKKKTNKQQIPKDISYIKNFKRLENSEFPYLEDLSKVDIDLLKNETYNVYVDPNKGNLIYCMDDNKKIFRYTRKQRIYETGRYSIQNKIEKMKTNNVKEIERELSMLNSKTCDFDLFREFIKRKNEANELLFEHYSNKAYRKMRLHAYSNKQQSEAKLVNNIKKFCGVKKKNKKHHKPIVLIYGDGNIGPQMKRIISTPMIGLKRMLSKHFPIVQMDEFRTSCLDYRTEKKNKKAIVPKEVEINGEKKMLPKELNGVLVSKILINGNATLSYQQRDKNAVLNFQKITKHFLETGTRPKKYCRSYKS